MKKFWRIALGLLVFVALLDLIWVGATHRYLNSPEFFAKISNPSIKFEGKNGYSPWPGYYHFDDFAFHGKSKQSTYQINAETLSFHLNVLDLLRHRVSIIGLNADEMTFDVEEVDAKDKDAKDKSGKDKDEKNADTDDEDKKSEDSEKDTGKKKWTTTFYAAEFSNLKRVKVDNWLWTGNSTWDIDLDIDSKGALTISDTTIEGQKLVVVHEDKKFAEFETAHITLGVEKFDSKKEKWKEILPKIETRWQVKGQLENMNSLASYWKNLSWFELEGKNVGIDGDIGLKKGVWEQDSHLVFKANALDLKIAKQDIRGPASLSWTVKKANAVELKFGEFRLNAGHDGDGKGFTLAMQTADKHVVPEWDDWSAKIEMPATRIHRIQFLQQYIPKSVPLTLEKGTGLLTAHLRAGSAVDQSQGTIEMKLQDVASTYKNKLHFVGDYDSKIKVRHLDLKKSEIRVDDTGVDITRLSFLDKKDWKGSLHFTNGKATFQKPNAVDGQVHLTGDNLQPVIAFLIKDKSLPAWLVKSFDVKNPKVDFHVKAGEDALAIRDFKAIAGDLAIEGWFDKKSDRDKGRFLVNYSGISGGYGFDGDKTQWKLSDAKSWYESEGKTRL